MVCTASMSVTLTVPRLAACMQCCIVHTAMLHVELISIVECEQDCERALQADAVFNDRAAPEHQLTYR